MNNACTCQDWTDNIHLINGPIVLAQVRSGLSAPIRPFVFCPWCGKPFNSTTDSASGGA